MTSNDSRRPPPRGHARHVAPTAILAAGLLAATAILAGAVRDSTAPPLYPQPVDGGPVVLTPDDPANP